MFTDDDLSMTITQSRKSHTEDNSTSKTALRLIVILLFLFLTHYPRHERCVSNSWTDEQHAILIFMPEKHLKRNLKLHEIVTLLTQQSSMSP